MLWLDFVGRIDSVAWQYSKEEFEKVVRTYGDDVFRLAYTRGGNADHAKDIYQSVFLKLYTSSNQFETGEHIKAWWWICLKMIIKTGEIVCVVKKADYNNNYASNMKAYGGVEFFTMQNYKTNTDTNV